MTDPNSRTTVVVPCYQEEDALQAFAQELPRLPADEVVFVDDGSTDGTATRLAALAAADPRVRVVTHERNLGVGAAMRSGFRAARGDVVVVYDADRTYPMADVERLVRKVEEGADLATAYPEETEGVPWGRRLLTRAAARRYRRALRGRGDGVRCFSCAFRAYRADWLARVPFESDGFPAAAEILGRALLGSARVEEVASRLSVRREGRSKMRLWQAIRGHRRVLRALRRLSGGAG